eukprot:6599058-Heterocapsa_arctica.AAC.1
MVGLICDDIEAHPEWDSAAPRQDGEMLANPIIVGCLKRAYMTWFGTDNPTEAQFYTVIGDASRSRRHMAAYAAG